MDEAAWSQHGSLLAAVDRLRVEIAAAWPTDPVPDRFVGARRYRRRVTAEPRPVERAQPSALDTPRQIRAALLPEEVGQFDSAWRAAQARATEALDLSEVHTVLDSRRRIARMTQSDPDAHRRMLRNAERALAGEYQPTGSEEEMRELIRRRLGT